MTIQVVCKKLSAVLSIPACDWQLSAWMQIQQLDMNALKGRNAA
jgi:hypothetical protein